MELTEQDRIKLREILLATYKYFEAFCDSHDIKFYACAGTAIGAIRHKGFIPWDDDIDVQMTRDQYEKLLCCKNEINNEDYEFIDIDTPGYYLPFAKLSHRHSTIIESKGLETPIGAYIDIFVLDSSDESKEKIYQRKIGYEKVCKQFLLCSIRHSWNEIFCSLTRGHLAQVLWYILQKLILHPLRPFIKFRVKHYLPADFNANSKWVVCYIGGYKEREICDPKIFDGTIDVPFEDTTIRIPKNYDWYLTQIYGDYMTPPPEEKRQSHHAHFYFNLEKRVVNF